MIDHVKVYTMGLTTGETVKVEVTTLPTAHIKEGRLYGRFKDSPNPTWYRVPPHIEEQLKRMTPE